MPQTNRSLCLLLLSCLFSHYGLAQIRWEHLSSKRGDLEVPNPGKEQTSSVVTDVDGDGINDFFITERTEGPAVTWYRRGSGGWTKYIVEADPLHIEAGSTAWDIDEDGDLDFVAGGDWKQNQIWWWENPAPEFDRRVPWKRHTIKDYGKPKHHDQVFGDADGDSRAELVFWNQEDHRLYLAEIPANPREAGVWESHVIYQWSSDGEMLQRGSYPDFKAINEHEGLAIIDLDGDGKQDIVGGGRWFKHLDGHQFRVHEIDASYAFSRCAVGQLISGGRPEVILVVGDGWAPMMMYEWRDGVWVPRVLLEQVDNGHSIEILDFNGDGHLDIWNAEMRLGGENPDARNRLLIGDGKGGFEEILISEGIGYHESKIADLDGDGDYDILGKPYGWDVPRLDIWLQNGTGARVRSQ